MRDLSTNQMSGYTKVIIDGRIYELKGDVDGEYLHRVASYVNEKLDEIKQNEGYKRMSEDMRKMLLYINLADDYFSLKEQNEKLLKDKEQHASEVYTLKHELVNEKLSRDDTDANTKRVQKELEDEKNYTKELEEKINALETRINTLDDERRDVEGKLSTIEDEKRMLEETNVALEETNKNHAEKIRELTIKSDELEKLLGEVTAPTSTPATNQSAGSGQMSFVNTAPEVSHTVPVQNASTQPNSSQQYYNQQYNQSKQYYPKHNNQFYGKSYDKK